MRYGYARVSTQEQETHAQIDALKRAYCDKIIQEKRSGTTMRRPALSALLRSLKRGDVVVVYKLDRLARSLRDFLRILDRIEDAGCTFVSITETIDTSSPYGRAMLQILGVFAELEAAMIRERTVAGMQAAINRGAKPGRPRGLTETDEQRAVHQFASGNFTKTALAREYGVHISTIKRAIARQRKTTRERATSQREPHHLLSDPHQVHD